MSSTKVKFKTTNKCRICKHKKLTRILHIPDMPFTDEFLSEKGLGSEFLSDIDIYICNNCGVVQNLKNVDMSNYYKDYRYSVNDSSKANNFMKDLAIKAVDRINKENLTVLEIGSGDGGQLIQFLNLGCNVIGFEPSEFLASLAIKNGVETITGLFEKNSAQQLPNAYRDGVDIIILSYTFDHLPDPVGFLKEVRSVLSDNGILIIEIHDLAKIVERNEYCLFEHEHYIYLSKKTAETVANLNGFQIVDFDLVNEDLRRGNSLLFVAEKSKQIVNFENDVDYLSELENNISLEIKKLDSFVKSKVDDGYKVAGFGAGGRGVMTLAAMKTAGLFSYLIDSNPKGVGIFAPKSHVGVYNLTKLKIDPVDIVIVFSYGYLDEITEAIMSLGYKENQILSMLDIQNP